MTAPGVTVADVVRYLEESAPPELAEEWDNTGLLVGADDDDVPSIMTCLTLTPDVAAEAVQRQCGLIVSHHPVLFRGTQHVSSRTVEGQMLLDLIRAKVAVYSPHTSYDSAREGINQQLAESLQLTAIHPLRELVGVELPAGAGRYGDLPEPVSLETLIGRAKPLLGVERTWYVGDIELPVQRVAVACGSAAEFLGDAAAAGCDVLLTGEARFHACLEARSLGVALILPGHYATERPAMETLATRLAAAFPQIDVWPSAVETDPVRWV